MGIPVVVLFPETPLDTQAFLDRVDTLVSRHGYCTVVVSEGCRYPNGNFIAEQGSKDAFGHAQLGGAAQVVAQMIKDSLKLKLHLAIADYLQRAARHIASATDVRHAYEVGVHAVELALAGENAVMSTIERLSDQPYEYRIGTAALRDIANNEKFMPRSMISEDRFSITQECRRYLLPLIEGEDYPSFKNGLPVYAKLAGNMTPKKLPDFKLG
jgi:6-phosphofructokinase 1